MFSGSNTPMGTFQTYVFQNGTLGYVYRDVFGADASLGSEAIIGEERLWCDCIRKMHHMHTYAMCLVAVPAICSSHGI